MERERTFVETAKLTTWRLSDMVTYCIREIVGNNVKSNILRRIYITPEFMATYNSELKSLKKLLSESVSLKTCNINKSFCFHSFFSFLFFVLQWDIYNACLSYLTQPIFTIRVSFHRHSFSMCWSISIGKKGVFESENFDFFHCYCNCKICIVLNNHNH